MDLSLTIPHLFTHVCGPLFSLVLTHPCPGITTLKGCREKLLAEVSQLEAEKDEIEDVLPILMEKLLSLHSSVADMHEERSVYDTALADMHEAYDMLLDPKTGGIMAGGLVPKGEKRGSPSSGGEEEEGYEGYGDEEGYDEQQMDPDVENLEML